MNHGNYTDTISLILLSKYSINAYYFKISLNFIIYQNYLVTLHCFLEELPCQIGQILPFWVKCKTLYILSVHNIKPYIIVWNLHHKQLIKKSYCVWNVSRFKRTPWKAYRDHIYFCKNSGKSFNQKDSWAHDFPFCWASAI